MGDARARGGSTVLAGAVVRWEHPSVAPVIREAALAMLSERERERWDTTPRRDAQDRFLIGRLLLRELAADLLGTAVGEITVDARCASCGGPHGRPQVTGPGSIELVASLSSCSGAVVAAVGLRDVVGTLGVDVEDVDDCQERAAAIDGLLESAALQERGRCAALRRWTRTEAVLKADGRGLTVDPALVAVRRQDGDLVASVADRPDSFLVIDHRIGRRAILSLAVSDARSQAVEPAGSAGSASL